MKLKQRIISLSNQNIERALNKSKQGLKGFRDREIWKVSKSKKNVVIIGIRRIGKTELLNHFVKDKLASKLIAPDDQSQGDANESFEDKDVKKLKRSLQLNPLSSGKNTKNEILYVKLDVPELLLLKESTGEIAVAIKELIKEQNVKLLLIDEIQILKKWNYFIKDLVYTYGKKIQIYATGSNANQLVDSSEHGTGRFETKFFGVLSFNEAKSVKDNHNLSDYIDFNHFPVYDLNQYDDEIFPLVIEKALRSGKSKEETLLKVLKGIIKNVGSETNLSRISKDSGVAKTHINNYIQDLRDAQLIFQVNNVAKSNQNTKIYLLVPGLNRLFLGSRFANLKPEEKGHLFEQFVLIEILAQKTKLQERINIEFYRKRDGTKTYEIDFIINEKLIEVKYSKSIDDIPKYVQMVKNLKKKELYFVYCGKTRNEKRNNIKIHFINWKEISNYEF